MDFNQQGKRNFSEVLYTVKNSFDEWKFANQIEYVDKQ